MTLHTGSQMTDIGLTDKRFNTVELICTTKATHHNTNISTLCSFLSTSVVSVCWYSIIFQFCTEAIKSAVHAMNSFIDSSTFCICRSTQYGSPSRVQCVHVKIL